MYNNVNNQKRTKILIIVFLIFCVFIISLAIWQQVSRIGKVKVEVKYAPYTARVEVDGKKVKNNGQTYLSPGNHEIKATQDGFDDLIQNIEVTDSTEFIYGIMEPNSEKGEEIYQKRLNEVLEVQGLYGMAAIQSGEQQRTEWPIISYLPINNTVYSIGYTIDQDNQLIIIIDASNTYLESAIDEIKSLPADKSLAEYNITFKSSQNPFTNKLVDNNASNPTDFLKRGYQNINCTVNEGIRDGNYYYTTITTGSFEEFLYLIHI